MRQLEDAHRARPWRTLIMEVYVHTCVCEREREMSDSNTEYVEHSDLQDLKHILKPK